MTNPEKDNGVKIGKNSKVSPSATLGRNVVIEDDVTIYENVRIGDNVVICSKSIIGEHLTDHYKNKDYKQPETYIGNDSLIRAGTVIYAGCELGNGTQTGNYAVIRENSLFGDFCSIGTLSQIDGFVDVGNYCRIHTNVFICQNTKIEDYAWIFPHVVFANDLHPPCSKCIEGPTIKEYAIIAAHSTILPKVKVGRNTLVCAKSLVTKDVPDNKVVAGAPAKVIKNIEEITCKYNLVERPYPWKNVVKRNYPWATENDQ